MPSSACLCVRCRHSLRNSWSARIESPHTARSLSSPETQGQLMPELLGVVIPTYNRRDVLAKVLDGYLNQSAIDRIGELVIVDDGSTDGTRSMVERFTSQATFPVRYLWQPNKGPAAARNTGIREARTDLILLTDSDIVPHRDLVAEHLRWHEQHPEPETAVLGYVTWPDEIRP